MRDGIWKVVRSAISYPPHGRLALRSERRVWWRLSDVHRAVDGQVPFCVWLYEVIRSGHGKWIWVLLRYSKITNNKGKWTTIALSIAIFMTRNTGIFAVLLILATSSLETAHIFMKYHQVYNILHYYLQMTTFIKPDVDFDSRYTITDIQVWLESFI